MLSVIRENGEEVLNSHAACECAVSQAFQHLKILDPETGDTGLHQFVLAELAGPLWMAGVAAQKEQVGK
jgi:hypothetical protein